ncbi:hypothetical protein GCM10027059_13630 [Myceligenerans halotolerans]
MPDTLVIDAPDAVRSMTNPVRLLAVTELYTTQKPRTATDLATLCGVSPSAMSYHLRELEGFGIVQRAPRQSDGRQRPWAAAARAYVLDAGVALGPDDRTKLLDSYLEPIRARMRGVLTRRSRVPETERDTLFNVLTTGELILTEDETRTLKRELEELFLRYEQLSWREGAEAGATPPGGEDDGYVRSRYLWSVVPDNPALYNLTREERDERDTA